MASCITGKLSIRRKIILFSSVGLGVATATYLAFITTNNPAVAAAIPALLSVAACPAMCVAVGGGMWLSTRFTRNKNKYDTNVLMDTAKEESYCSSNSFSHLNEKEQVQQRDIDVFESKHEKDSTLSLQQKQPERFEN